MTKELKSLPLHVHYISYIIYDNDIIYWVTIMKCFSIKKHNKEPVYHGIMNIASLNINTCGESETLYEFIKGAEHIYNIGKLTKLPMKMEEYGELKLRYYGMNYNSPFSKFNQIMTFLDRGSNIRRNGVIYTFECIKRSEPKLKFHHQCVLGLEPYRLLEPTTRQLIIDFSNLPKFRNSKTVQSISDIDWIIKHKNSILETILIDKLSIESYPI